MYNQISILRHHIYKATEHGANFRELCRRLKVSPEQLNDGEAYLSWEPGEETDFWTHAIELTGDPCLGLHMGERPDSHNAFGLVGMLAGKCRNIREALQMICKFNDTLTGVFTYTLAATDEHAVFSFNPHPIWEETNLESARQAVDTFMSSLLRSLHHACVRKIYPVKTELRYTKRFVEEYQRILKSPVIFNSSANCFLFRKEDMNIQLLNHDQSMFSAFNSILIEKQNRLGANQSIINQIKHLLIAEFRGQITSLDIIASRLCMTTRTLQRKLGEESTSYREICNDIRREIALDLLKTGKSNKRQVASLLGYADSSTFNKAYRSWKMKEN